MTSVRAAAGLARATGVGTVKGPKGSGPAAPRWQSPARLPGFQGRSARAISARAARPRTHRPLLSRRHHADKWENPSGVALSVKVDDQLAKSFASQNIYCTDASHKPTSCDTSILGLQRISPSEARLSSLSRPQCRKSMTRHPMPSARAFRSRRTPAPKDRKRR